MFDGILLLDKQPGETSTGCVQAVWKLLGRKTKVGHGGTLDSPASGLLVLLVGVATRTCNFVQSLSKTYIVEAQLGAVSDTDDATGKIDPAGETGKVAFDDIERALFGFLGTRLQVPPSVSAVHVAGKRAHVLARAGESPSLSSRPITISSFSDLQGPDPLGRIRFKIECHKGTYVRSLVRDLGKKIGCGAYVLSLGRLSLGHFTLARAVRKAQLVDGNLGFLMENLLPMDTLLDHFVTYRVPQAMEKDVRNGRAIPSDALQRVNWGEIPETGHVVLRTEGLASFALPSAPETVPFSYRPDVVLTLEDRS